MNQMSRVTESEKEDTNRGRAMSDKFPGPLFRLNLKLVVLSIGVSSGTEGTASDALK